jgi:hypothetical protein
MLRKARIDAPGALHHIIIRGIERNGTTVLNRNSERIPRSLLQGNLQL